MPGRVKSEIAERPHPQSLHITSAGFRAGSCHGRHLCIPTSASSPCKVSPAASPLGRWANRGPAGIRSSPLVPGPVSAHLSVCGCPLPPTWLPECGTPGASAWPVSKGAEDGLLPPGDPSG